MANAKVERGIAVHEVMHELAFRNHLRKLAEQRDKYMAAKKNRQKKEACADGYAQASIKELTLDNDNTKTKECQARGGAVCDD